MSEINARGRGGRRLGRQHRRPCGRHARRTARGVIAVGGLRHVGTKVGFSDLGPEIAISAPGGNCVNVAAGRACLYPILTATERRRDDAGEPRSTPTASTRRWARASRRRWWPAPSR